MEEEEAANRLLQYSRLDGRDMPPQGHLSPFFSEGRACHVHIRRDPLVGSDQHRSMTPSAAPGTIGDSPTPTFRREVLVTSVLPRACRVYILLVNRSGQFMNCPDSPFSVWPLTSSHSQGPACRVRSAPIDDLFRVVERSFVNRKKLFFGLF